MLTLSRKVQGVEESQTLALSAKARSMKEAGVDVISLTAGEPDFPTPRHVKEAAIKAIEANFTHYTANQGIPELLDAIVKKFGEDNDLHFETNQILVSSGAKQSIFNALQAICNKGDEVVIISPFWVSYPEMVKLADATPVIVKTCADDGFRVDRRRLRQSIHPKTKALIINSPGNPTGVVYTRSEMEDIAAIVKETGIFVITDEIYEKVIYDGSRHFSLGSIKSIRDQVITINGVSKAYAMTGWRIGFMGGPAKVMEEAAKVQSQVTSNPNSIAQKATVAALLGPTSDLEMMVREFHRRRDLVYKSLSSIPYLGVQPPGGAFYFLFDIQKYYGKRFKNQLIKNSNDMARYLLEHHHVALVPGVAFGADDCLRMSYACSMTDLEKGVNRIKQGLEALA
ncbi:MAG: pyridoxal phosphate-dependent aminotransferase [Ignavibacteriae bacterium]|nr:pyridoxal phosphate-dependent aminotransferase [Ignavibacteriota bacterium]